MVHEKHALLLRVGLDVDRALYGAYPDHIVPRCSAWRRALRWADAPHAGGSILRSLGWRRRIVLEPMHEGTLLLTVAVLRNEEQQQLGIPFLTILRAADQESLGGTQFTETQ